MTDIDNIQKAIHALEAQRSILGDAVVDAALDPLRRQLAVLKVRRADQQRKYATALFADISGFTAMSERLDAEEVNNIMNALWERLDATILQHGGYIDKHIGDAVLAFWGIQAARENDPESAVRAALEMQHEVTLMASSPILVSLDSPLVLHIGIHTGLVLISEVGAASGRTVVGDTVITAERLGTIAQPGSVLISHDTCRHVQGLFEMEPGKDLELAGRSETLHTYLVLRRLPRSLRQRVHSVEALMVGRDVELKALHDALQAVRSGNERRIITVIGEAGIGKSRLLYEFRRNLGDQYKDLHIFNGMARPEMQSQPYALLHDLFVMRYQIQDSDAPALVRQKFEQGIRRRIEGDEQEIFLRAHFIGQLAGFDFSDSPYLKGVLADARQLHDRALAYLLEFLQTLSQSGVVLILLEDIHWADASSLELVNHLAQQMPRQLLVICTARASIFERLPDWGTGQDFHYRQDLCPLDDRESRMLIAEILKHMKEIPAELYAMIIGNAEGNPYYIEELVKMLIEDGIILHQGDSWEIDPARLTDVRVPPTLTGVIQSRLDSLDSLERDVLQRAAVIGRTFWDEAVEFLDSRLFETYDELPVSQVLEALVCWEMITPNPQSTFAGVREFSFQHNLLRQVTYESVLKRERRSYHARAAEWLIQRRGDRFGEYIGLLAEHLELAGRIEQAVKYLTLAGQQAADRFANQEALALLEHALELAPSTDYAARYTVLQARIRVLELLGQREVQKHDLAVLSQLAEYLDDDRKRSEVTLSQAKYDFLVADYQAALMAVRKAADLAHRMEDVCSEVEAHLLEARTYIRLSDSATARQQLDLALQISRHARQVYQEDVSLDAQHTMTEMRRLQADILRSLGILVAEPGDHIGARHYFEEALLLHREVGDRRGESSALNNLGLVCTNLGEFAQARQYYEQCLWIKREIGDRRGEAIASNNIALVCIDQGEYAVADAYLGKALELYRSVGDRDGENGALVNMGLVRLALGDYPAARKDFAQALEIARQISDRYGEALILADQALLCCQEEDYLTARSLGQEALRIALQFEDARSQGYAWMHLGHAAIGLKEFSEASLAYQHALELRRSLGLEVQRIEALAGLSFAAFARGDLERALVHAVEILEYFQIGESDPGAINLEHALDGALEPERVYLWTARVLQAAQHPRYADFLAAAHQCVQKQAAQISLAGLRQAFLENVPSRREVVAMFNELPNPISQVVGDQRRM